jgi:hypothetical protein
MLHVLWPGLGGNAAIMATKLVGLGSNVRVLLGSEAGPKLRELLPERVIVPEEGQVSTDEVCGSYIEFIEFIEKIFQNAIIFIKSSSYLGMIGFFSSLPF